MRKYLALLICLCLFAAGCGGTVSKVKRVLGFTPYTDTEYEAKSDEHPIDLYFGDAVPRREYVEIGEISGFVLHVSNIKSMLRTRARRAGGDAVMDIRFGTGQSPSSSLTLANDEMGLGPDKGMTTTAIPRRYGVRNNIRTNSIRAKVIRYTE